MLLGRDYLKIYLEDHYAGGTAGVELARRTAGANRGSEYGPGLERLAEEIAEDHDSLRTIMGGLGFGPDRLKSAAAWTGEKLGRLKLNGHLTSYSPASRVLELEGLVLGVTAKLAMWVALLDSAELEPRLPRAEIERLRDRAERQRDQIEELRLRAFADAVAAADR